MTYSSGYPVRLAGGRLALDFINTADWSAGGEIVHEKVADLDDLAVWQKAVGIPRASPPKGTLSLHNLRSYMRSAIQGGDPAATGDMLSFLKGLDETRAAGDQPLTALLALSAISILIDPRERDRVKMCPGVDCGWCFADETKNRRRKWCLMETCGNRAKSARHYEKVTSGTE